MEEKRKIIDWQVKKIRRTLYRIITGVTLASTSPHKQYYSSAATIYYVTPNIITDIIELVYIALFRWVDR